eukprot:10441-Eustigmatos_ZCMA.PRE.1
MRHHSFKGDAMQSSTAHVLLSALEDIGLSQHIWVYLDRQDRQEEGSSRLSQTFRLQDHVLTLTALQRWL